ncbi:MAG: glycosyltransferase family 2 protein [candidate division Zixibacteria bacterium]|jgi:GT2 family glycosyltransferase|nr:glycosyltransferase family 2 protein [candidate division Zixibacteria bacterium]
MIFVNPPNKPLSIVIVNYNVKNLLRKCLESIFKYEKDAEFEVIVVDNNSKDYCQQMLKKDFPQVQLIENKQNSGFSRACNQGIKESQGRYILLLNPDTELTPGGFKKMIDFMDSKPEVGICGPKMMDQEGNLQFSCRSFPSYLTAISSSQSILNRIFPENFLSQKYLLKEKNHSQIMEVNWVSGSCLLAKRETFEKIGLLDERFYMYVEDVDLCYRAKKLGFSVFYFPSVVVIHHIGKSTQKRKFAMLLEHHRSMYYFYRKHHNPNVFLRGIVFLSVWMRLFFVLGMKPFLA